jgi:pantoate--beta-alanine ligase
VMWGVIESEPLAAFDYAEVVDAHSLQVPKTLSGELRLLGAIRFSRVRLIDNIGARV